MRSCFVRACIALAIYTACVTSLAAQHAPSGTRPRVRSAHARATIVDSLARALASDDWNDRHAALRRIQTFRAVPPSLVEPVIALLRQEAAQLIPIHPADDTEEDGFGEYVMELALTAYRTRDPRTRRPLVLIGALSIADGIARFIAQGGTPMFPVLDSAARVHPLQLANVVNVYALMLAKFPRALAPHDSAHVLAALLRASGDSSTLGPLALATVGGRMPVPEFTPLLQYIAHADTVRVQGLYERRDLARSGAETLAPRWRARPSRGIIAILTRATEGLCDLSARPIRPMCLQMRASLRAVDLALDRREPAATRTAIRDLRRLLDTAHRTNALSDAEYAFFDGNAELVASR